MWLKGSHSGIIQKLLNSQKLLPGPPLPSHTLFLPYLPSSIRDTSFLIQFAASGKEYSTSNITSPSDKPLPPFLEPLLCPARWQLAGTITMASSSLYLSSAGTSCFENHKSGPATHSFFKISLLRRSKNKGSSISGCNPLLTLPGSSQPCDILGTP